VIELGSYQVDVRGCAPRDWFPPLTGFFAVPPPHQFDHPSPPVFARHEGGTVLVGLNRRRLLSANAWSSQRRGSER
jgi:hypothetical protein